MDFRLVYQGPLKASSNAQRRVKEKHAIRAVLHIQLRELWKRHPQLKRRLEDILVEDAAAKHGREIGAVLASPHTSEVETIASKFELCGFRFVPLISSNYKLACSLSVLFLRRDDPGNLVSSGGDIDNRIKTLLDALRVPRNSGEIGNATPSAGENPMFCLLEDDSLISELNVTTDRLLLPLEQGQRETDVHLVIQVRTQLTDLTLLNLEFVS